MKYLKTFLAIAMLASMTFSTLTLTGCKKQGPAEAVGEKIDKAADEAGDAANKAGEEVKDAVDDTTN